MEIAASPAHDGSILRRHHPIGASTGYMKELRNDWPAQITEAWAVSPFAVELSVLSENELPSFRDYLATAPTVPFRYRSVHGPSKNRRVDEDDLVDKLLHLAEWADAIVMHPDTIEDPQLYRALGPKLLIENMDARKGWGRTREELEKVFEELPEAAFCFDIAHAWSIDRGMTVSEELLDAFRERLGQVHISSLTSDLRHVPLTEAHEELFRPFLQRCLDVPWILEAPLRPS